MTVDLVFVGYGVMFSAMATALAALASDARRRRPRVGDVAFYVLMAFAAVYLAAHSFLAGLPIA